MSAEVVGRFLLSEASTHLLVFDMEHRLPPHSELVQAVLRLFQEPVPKAALRRHERLFPRSDRARVTVQWLHIREDGSNRTSLIDSRWGAGGWGAFRREEEGAWPGAGGRERGEGGAAGSRPRGVWERGSRGCPEPSRSPPLSAGLSRCGVAGWCPSTRAAGRPWT